MDERRGPSDQSSAKHAESSNAGSKENFAVRPPPYHRRAPEGNARQRQRPYGFYSPAVDVLLSAEKGTLRERLIAALQAEGLDAEKATLVASGMAIAAVATVVKLSELRFILPTSAGGEERRPANDDRAEGDAA